MGDITQEINVFVNKVDNKLLNGYVFVDKLYI